MIQGTEEWRQARLGSCTASKFADIWSRSRSKDGLSATAERYMQSLLSEHLTGKPANKVKTKAMEWGTYWEPFARMEYEQTRGTTVQQVGFIPHGSEPFVGCSPDGIICGEFLDKICLEIKCPETPEKHIEVLESGAVPKDHVAQVQGVTWLTSSRACDFISFHPDFPDRWRMLVVRVDRDDQYISELSRRVIAFRDEMVMRLNSIIERWEK